MYYITTSTLASILITFTTARTHSNILAPSYVHAHTLTRTHVRTSGHARTHAHIYTQHTFNTSLISCVA